MLQKQNRVRKQKEYDRIFAKNKRLKSENFLILIHYRRNQLEPKFGIIVSSKVGKAVTRNKIKRRLRAILRSNLSKFSKDAEYVIIAYPQIANLNFENMTKEVEKAIETLKVI
jgi:ribonuclease P protein component